MNFSRGFFFFFLCESFSLRVKGGLLLTALVAAHLSLSDTRGKNWLYSTKMFTYAYTVMICFSHSNGMVLSVFWACSITYVSMHTCYPRVFSVVHFTNSIAEIKCPSLIKTYSNSKGSKPQKNKTRYLNRYPLSIRHIKKITGKLSSHISSTSIILWKQQSSDTDVQGVQPFVEENLHPL